MPAPKALILLAPGFEDLEAVTVIDLLRRAKIQLTIACLHDDEVTGSRGTRIVADTSLALITRDQIFDAVILPGGQPGADNLAADSRVIKLLQAQTDAGRIVAGICAAPKVLAAAGITRGKRITHFPGILDGQVLEETESTGAPVEVDGKLITGRGPGTAIDFALTLVEQLTDRAIRDAVEQSLAR